MDIHLGYLEVLLQHAIAEIMLLDKLLAQEREHLVAGQQFVQRTGKRQFRLSRHVK